MTIRSALSKLLPIILKLWGVDTTTPLVRYDRHDQLARATARRIYTRNGVRVSISHYGALPDQRDDFMPRKGD
jgi:hypothetical protein